jgi:hypothetical protein
MDELVDMEGRTAVVVSMHEKQKVIEPVFQHFNFTWLKSSIDTDVYGTFSGEINRQGSALDAARKKCLGMFNQSDVSIAIASEGSFGCHPYSPFIAMNEELIVFMDRKNDCEFSINSASILTNFASRDCTSLDELWSFAAQALFPSHGIILRSLHDESIVFKGITDSAQLEIHFLLLHRQDGVVRVQTDMRANYNPTRMSHIQEVAKKLVNKIKTHCPECNARGFGDEKKVAGLPCSNCKLPTKSAIHIEKHCQQCGFVEIVQLPDVKVEEDPMYCDFCNP